MESETEEGIQPNVLVQLKNNKILVIILIAALILGFYLRFDDYGAEGYNSDDMNTIPAAVFAYYPHDYFPGLVSTEPPLGNYIIGLGCMASGEDFSKVSNVKPLFFPDRSAYIGEAVKNAENYCWAPIYIFGILFLIGVIIFAFSFFSDIYSSAYFIIFFIFFSEILASSRRLKVDIILFTFVIFALAFLWKGYKAKKGLFKEYVYFFIAFAFLGLGGATKFPIGALMIFSFLLLLEKYKDEVIHITHKLLRLIDLKILENKVKENVNIKSLLINIIVIIFSASFFMMLFFNFSIKNLLDTYYYMTSLNWSGVQTLGFSISNFFHLINELLIKLNFIDILIYIFSIFILIKIIFKKHKTQQEKFAVYMLLLCFLIVTIFKSGVVSSVGHAMPFMFGFFILASLAFSNKTYSIFNTLKIKQTYFTTFMILYVIISFFSLYFAPFHQVYKNPLYCSVFNAAECEISLYSFSTKPVTKYFDSVLKEDETFLPTGIYNFYTRHNDDIFWWMFYSSFMKQTGKEPRLEDYLKYYKPEGSRVRYVHTDVSTNDNPEDMKGLGIDTALLKKDYKPNHIIKIFDKDSAYIYDLDNLIKK